jgi:serine/threonine-protein kinase
MQDLLRDLFKKHGYRVLVTSDPERARDRFVSDPATAEVVLFTSAHAGRTALDVFNQLGADKVTQHIPAVLLLDERHRDWKAEANVGPHRATINMPIKQRELRKTIRDVITGAAV